MAIKYILALALTMPPSTTGYYYSMEQITKSTTDNIVFLMKRNKDKPLVYYLGVSIDAVRPEWQEAINALRRLRYKVKVKLEVDYNSHRPVGTFDYGYQDIRTVYNTRLEISK